MTPQTYGNLIFDQEGKIIQGKQDIFNKQCWSNWMSASRRMQIDLYLSSYTKQVQLDQRPQHISRYTKYPRREIRKQVQHIGTGNNFLNRTPMPQALRPRIDKWDVMKLESFFKVKDIANRKNQQPTIGENASLIPHLIVG